MGRQAYTYVDNKKVLLWEDEDKTIPKMEDDWGYKDYTLEELESSTDDDLQVAAAKVHAIDEIIDVLSSLIQ